VEAHEYPRAKQDGNEGARQNGLNTLGQGPVVASLSLHLVVGDGHQSIRSALRKKAAFDPIDLCKAVEILSYNTLPQTLGKKTYQKLNLPAQ
jgi:hypothetical protein